jgi:hypothetical protein
MPGHLDNRTRLLPCGHLQVGGRFRRWVETRALTVDAVHLDLEVAP